MSEINLIKSIQAEWAMEERIFLSVWLNPPAPTTAAATNSLSIIRMYFRHKFSGWLVSATNWHKCHNLRDIKLKQ